MSEHSFNLCEGWSTNVKLNFLHWESDFFPANLSEISEKGRIQRERVYQDIKEMGKEECKHNTKCYPALWRRRQEREVWIHVSKRSKLPYMFLATSYIVFLSLLYIAWRKNGTKKKTAFKYFSRNRKSSKILHCVIKKNTRFLNENYFRTWEIILYKFIVIHLRR